MQNRFRFLNWTLAATALVPLTVVLWVCGHMLYIIWPDLDEKQKAGLIDGLAVISIPGLASAAAALWHLRKQTTLPRSHVVALLALNVSCFYIFFQYIQPHIAFRDWMFDQDTYLGMVVSALIPLFYYLLYYLAECFAIADRRALVVTIVSSVVLPLLMYLGFNVVRLSLHGDIFTTRLGHILFISVTAAFSFMLIRLGVYIVRQKAAAFEKPALVWGIQFVCVGVLPFIGLALNATGPVARESQMVLGNFTAREFWILTGFNALVYLVPMPKSYPIALALAGLRSAGLGFVLYFCAVFLLYLPLALLLIAAIGLGLLLLIPYATAAAQILRLKTDFKHLTQARKKGGVITVLAVGFLLLPLATLLHVYAERSMLRSAIQFVERPPLSLNYAPDFNKEKLLELATTRPPNRRGFRGDMQNVPIYDALYRSVVLDGADLGESIRKKIKLVFAGVNEFTPRVAPALASAELADVKVTTSANQDAYQSDLRVKVKNRGKFDAEFFGKIELPDNAFITGHWLTIDGVEVPAQITTKSTAIWVYNRVTEARRDPSLIYYEGKNLLLWKIFPVPATGFREARLKITHFGDATLSIAGKALRLKGKEFTPPISTSGRTTLLPQAESATKRKPYLHLVLNCSREAKKNYFADAQEAANELRLSLSAAKVSFVNDGILTRDFGQATQLACPKTGGGFFAELALRSILFAQFGSGGAGTPVIAVLSSRAQLHVSPDLSYLTAFYGDADGWLLHDGEKMTAYNFMGATAMEIHFPLPVRNFGGRYFSAKPTVAILEAGTAKPVAIPQPTLDGFEHFYDYILGEAPARARAVLSAIQTGVINPATGSIVLETEAQRRRLADLHKKTLNSRNELDTGEQPRMSEPWAFLLLAVPLLFWLRREKKTWFFGI